MVSQLKPPLASQNWPKMVLSLFLVTTQLNAYPIWVGRIFNWRGLQVCSFIKKRLYHKSFLANIIKLLRPPIFKNFWMWILSLICMLIICIFYHMHVFNEHGEIGCRYPICDWLNFPFYSNALKIDIRHQ